jgi:hypothetical protein
MREADAEVQRFVKGVTRIEAPAGTQPRMVRRREDQLAIRFEFVNLTLVTTTGRPTLHRVGTGEAYVVAVFSAQHVVEQSFREATGSGSLGSGLPGSTTTDPPTWPVNTRVAGPSRLAFALPRGVDTLSFNLETLLRWTQLAVSVVPAALPRGAKPGSPPQLRAPQPVETAIELPWRLVLSPHAGAGWAHATRPVTRNGRTELWHTRLGVRRDDGGVDERDPAGRTLRAVWSTDPDFAAWLANPSGAPSGDTVPAAGLPFRMPLTPRNRVEIVRATADHSIAGYVPDPVDVQRLMLTAQGGWLDVRGAWLPPAGAFAIREWRHRTTAGRDQNVRVVEQGYLLPFGHRAAVVSVAERAVGAAPNGAPVAYLRQRFYLVVRQPTKTYPAFGQDLGGRRMPFRRVTVTTVTTPILDDKAPFGGQSGAFVPKVAGAPYEFHVVAEDPTGRHFDFTTPAVFVDATVAFDESKMSGLRSAYNDGLATTDPIRRRPLPGQSVALAESAVPGDTDVEVAAVTFAADAPASGVASAGFASNDQPRCYPAAASVTVRLRSAEQLSGGQLGATEVKFDPTYLSHGFDVAKNPGQVYARLVDPVGFALGSDRAGPMTLAMDISGLSRTLGTVGGDLDTLKTGTLDTAAILAAASADTPRFFGAIELKDMVRPTSVAGGKVPDDALTLTTARGDGAVASAQSALTAQSPGQVGEIYKLRWTQKLYDDLLGGLLSFSDHTYAWIDLEYRVDTAGPHSLETMFQVLISHEKPWPLVSDLPDNTPPGPLWRTKPSLTLRIFGFNGFIEVDFIKFVFRAETGKDVYVNPTLGDIRFLHELRFIQKIQELFSSPSKPGQPSPGLILKPSFSSIEVGLKINMPSFAVGAMALKNLYVGFSVFIPFSSPDGGPHPARIQFRLSDRDNPFLLGIYWFGGGGSLLIGLGFDGVEWFEISLEFGVHAEINIGGVIGGSASIMAGIYFEAKRVPTTNEVDCVLTGFVRMRGMVELLGIVTITLSVYLGLTYRSAGNKVIGQATLTLEVEVWFFSLSVSVQVERQFSGEPNDPAFLDLMPSQEHWDDYVSAFAAIGG